MENIWIEHKGKKILVNDYTGIKLEREMIAHLNDAIGLVANLTPGTEVLMLIDFTGAFTTPGYIEVARKTEKETIEKYKVKRAVLGITGAKEILLKGFNLFAKQKLTPFQTRQEALDYLIK